jgi:hypothetical protein
MIHARGVGSDCEARLPTGSRIFFELPSDSDSPNRVFVLVVGVCTVSLPQFEWPRNLSRIAHKRDGNAFVKIPSILFLYPRSFGYTSLSFTKALAVAQLLSHPLRSIRYTKSAFLDQLPR